MPKVLPVFQSKRGINRPTSFVEKLYNILRDKSNATVIAWCEEGTSFIVVDKKKFSESILPKFFRHGKFSSFVRQLNMYDFHKVGEPTWLEYSHENFQRDREEDLHLVGRKTNTGVGSSGNGNLHAGSSNGQGGMKKEGSAASAAPARSTAVEESLRGEVQRLQGEVHSLQIQLAQALRANSNLVQQHRKQAQQEVADMYAMSTFSPNFILASRQGPLETPTLRAHFEMVEEPTTGNSVIGGNVHASSASFAGFDAYSSFGSQSGMSSSSSSSSSSISSNAGGQLSKRDSMGSDLRCDEVLDAQNNNSSHSSSLFPQPMYQQPQVYYNVSAEPTRKGESNINKVWERKQVESSPAPEDEEIDFYNLYLSDEPKVPDMTP